MALPPRHAKTIQRLERFTRYLWAAQVAAGRAVLDVGCGDGAGTSVLSAAGGSPVHGVDSSAEAVERARREHGDAAGFELGEPTALPVPERSFDLITCFGVLETSPDPEAVLGGIARALKPGGLLLASVPGSPRAGSPASDPAEALRQRFASVGVHRQAHYAGTAIDWAPDAEIRGRTSGSPEDARPTVLVAASADDLPALEPRASFEPVAGLESLLDSLSQWEERAREAEAEVAVMRWEVRIAGEKLVALVNRLVELENAPARRARRRLRGERGRVSPGEIADAAAADAGEVRPNRA